MPHRDIDHLVKAMLTSAKGMLSSTKTLSPFAAEMLHDGEVITRCSRAQGSTLGNGNAKDAVAHFESEFRLKASGGEIRAVAICMSVTTPDANRARKVHAICISVEHESGEAIDVYCPYRKGWFGRVRFDDCFSQRRKPKLFRIGAGTTCSLPPTDARTLGALAPKRIQIG